MRIRTIAPATRPSPALPETQPVFLAVAAAGGGAVAATATATAAAAAAATAGAVFRAVFRADAAAGAVAVVVGAGAVPTVAAPTSATAAALRGRYPYFSSGWVWGLGSMLISIRNSSWRIVSWITHGLPA